jgi:Nodulation protein Z (NodZ)
MKFAIMSAEKNHVGDRFVVSIRMTGLGDRLASLAAAWRFARNTGRTLAHTGVLAIYRLTA